MGALSKGFRILEAVRTASDEPSFSDIVAATGLPKATVHRLLNELVALGALTYDEGSRCYRFGLLLAKLGAAVAATYDVRQVARPHIEALHRKTGHVVTLGIRDDDNGIYLDKIESKDFGIRLHSEVGKSFPLHCTAMGKVLLANADESLINRIAGRRLRSYTEKTITSGQQLRDELENTRQRGYAIDNEEITRGLICVAAPVYGIDGKLAAALSCTVPGYVLEETRIEQLIGLVTDTARAASGTVVR
ncbi:MAG TPA: IclR family transcriptional regulator [Woeseiaceae bacterium]|nr:IclR family transcriptional regulator [Woeseiaceae bacterium]